MFVCIYIVLIYSIKQTHIREVKVPRSLADHLQLWRNNTHPGPHYEGFVVEITNFNPLQYGQVTYDYGTCQYFLQMVNHASGKWFRTKITLPSLGTADNLRRSLTKATGIPEKNIFGIEPNMATRTTTLPSVLTPKNIKGEGFF
jgi:hypothetical protein